MLVDARISETNLKIFELCVLHYSSLEFSNVVKTLEPFENHFRIVRVSFIPSIVVESVVNEEEAWICCVRIVIWDVVWIIADVKKLRNLTI